MGADNVQTDKIDVAPSGANGDGQLANGNSADTALIQYAKDPAATVDLQLAGQTCRFNNGLKEMDKVPLVNGSVAVPFYSRTSEYVTLTAYLSADHGIYGSYDFHFAPAVKRVDLAVVPGCGTAPPDGVTPDKVKATVYGYDDHGVAHVPVTFQPDPSATLSPPQPQTSKSDGTATVSITNTVAGDVAMTATAGGVASSPVTVHFQPVTATVKSVALSVDPQTAPADGTTAVQGTAVVAMNDGTLAPDGTLVTFTPTNGATANPSPAPTLGGVATTRITSTTVGPSDVTASAGGVTSSSRAVTFTAPAVAVQAVILTADRNLGLINGHTPVQATVLVTMSDGTLACDGTQVTFTPTDGATVSPATATLSGGQAKTAISCNVSGFTETPVTASVTATADGTVSNPVTVRFLDGFHLYMDVEVVADWAQNGGRGKDVVRATVTYGDPGSATPVRKGMPVSIRQGLPGLPPPDSPELSFRTADGGPPFTDDSGQVTFNVQCPGSQTGEFDITTATDDLGIQDGSYVHFSG